METDTYLTILGPSEGFYKEKGSKFYAFGGTKLGISGLIRAYKTAASDALDHAVIRKVDVTTPIRIVFGYESTAAVMRLVDELKLEIKRQVFEQNCELVAEIKVSQVGTIKKKAGSLMKQGIKVAFEPTP